MTSQEKIVEQLQDLIAELEHVIELVEDNGEEGFDAAIDELTCQSGTVNTIIETLNEGL